MQEIGERLGNGGSADAQVTKSQDSKILGPVGRELDCHVYQIHHGACPMNVSCLDLLDCRLVFIGFGGGR